MAVQTALKFTATKIHDAVKSVAEREGLDEGGYALVGTYEKPTGRIYLNLGSDRKIDEARWYVGILAALRREFGATPWVVSKINLVVRNVERLDQVYAEAGIDDDEIDFSDLL